MKTVIPGTNDLATIRPDLAAEWHPTKNGNLLPSQVLPGTHTKVWWLGKCGHEWTAAICKRNAGRNCPICAGKQVLQGYNDLATVNPELAAEWHPTKNGDLKPSDVTAGSNKKVWWLGKCGHEWCSDINNRHKGRGCPYCANQKLLPGFNDLATVNPELAAEWHPTKNGDLKPEQVITGSNKKAWWQCSEGHEWQAIINNRTDKNSGCPYCSGHKAVAGKTDFATVNPELAAEWHPTKNGDLKPSDVTANSGKKVWWQCAHGHSWQATPHTRARIGKNTGCPYCSGRRALPGTNDLATTHPELVAEWHPTKNGDLTPAQVKKGTNKKVWWYREECGHEWQAAVHNRACRNDGCPVCNSENHTSFPEQAIFYYLKQLTLAENRHLLNGEIEIDIYMPAYKLGIEYDGHHHKTKQKEDIKKSRLCTKHGIRLIRIRVPDLPILPVECIVLQSDKDNELEAAIQQICAILGKELDVDIDRDRSQIHEQYIESRKQNSLAVKNPEVAAEWHPTKNGKLTPEQVAAGSTKKAWWQCSEGHEWQAQISSRNRGVGCPICANKQILQGYNDLATVNPELAAEWHPTKNGNLTPEQVTAGSQKRVWWQCAHGHEWQNKVYHRSAGIGCPYCSGRRAFPGYNDLATVNSGLATEWHPTKNGDLKPSDVTANSDKRVWWYREECGHEWQEVVGRRHKMGLGCPICSNRRVLQGYNDLATVNPELAAEWHPTKNGDLKPSDVAYGSAKKVWWQCSEGHEWKAQIYSRNKGGHKCPYCVGRKKA